MLRVSPCREIFDMATAATEELNIRIAQSDHYHGDDWWTWSIWLEGSDEALDQIEQVVYQLHPTFPDPVRTVTQRTSKFKLSGEGWGVFTIYARALTKTGGACKLSHELELRYPDGTATQA